MGVNVEVKERPILFSGEMVKAILEGRKTQTRRVMKVQPVYYVDVGIWTHPQLKGEEDFWFDAESMALVLLESEIVKCPYGYAYVDGTPGDRLWVRETWQGQNINFQWWHEVPREDRPLWNWAWTNPVEPAYDTVPPRWIPAIHMPRMASRITLEVVNVRVERVQDITEDDAKAEGTTPSIVGDDLDHLKFRAGFQSLWDKINASRGFGWDVNPWVWVLEFKAV